MAKAKRVSIPEFLRRLKKKARTVKFYLKGNAIRSDYYCPLAAVFGTWIDVRESGVMSKKTWARIIDSADNRTLFGTGPDPKLRKQLLKAVGLSEAV